jgi:hypothetical protein
MKSAQVRWRSRGGVKSDEFTKLNVPVALQQIDIADLARVEPRELILHPVLVADAQAAGRAIVYARSGDQTSYDDIGLRTFAASPRKGVLPFQTSAWSAMQREMIDRQKRDPVFNEILNQQTKLRHRPLSYPGDAGSLRYVIDNNAIHFYRRKNDSAGHEVEDLWTISRTHIEFTGTIDRDEPSFASQLFPVGLQATYWLPFPVLLTEGRFCRFQDIRSRLVRETKPGPFYWFLSHRWLDPTHPDPDSLQAQFAAWQMIAYLAEAVRVADQRGLHTPRRFHPGMGITLGPRGADLAESLIVNVLRFALDADTLRKAAEETLSLEMDLADHGIAKAAKDVGLKELNGFLADRPILRTLTERIYIWYDYSCIPQVPREGGDVDLFIKGLGELSAAQAVGRTAIMLDDVNNYLSRGWCTLEALVADNLRGAADVIVGSARPSTDEGEVEVYFKRLLEDRPHVLWRAILDTEIFGIQSPTVCMQRLGLAFTDPNDLSFIYKRFSTFPAPVKVHFDDSEIVTGALPLPAFENGSIIVRARSSNYVLSEKPIPTATLDWTQALLMSEAWDPNRDSAAIPSFLKVSEKVVRGRSSCHVAIVGACEGEAILFANWAERNKKDLESLLSVTVTSISWTASDIAPVGHMALGVLETVPVMADTWVTVAMSERLQQCRAAIIITESLRWSGITYATVALDIAENNVKLPEQEQPPEGITRRDLLIGFNIEKNRPRVHLGGLFQWQIPEELL